MSVRTRTGWAVTGDTQHLPGYCLPLHGPVRRYAALSAVLADAYGEDGRGPGPEVSRGPGCG
ncbi:hypothetical protein [Streptacidiphilus sp. P02-A3a]|uniref:hypothetical protein n=1 Tax=Streptacidiphilus sp. P02-A3a TaxID=2704468 RepID=UPI001CDC065A|nr:hypothetical protein [Streptacidiphilus sp. P02-A3a]